VASWRRLERRTAATPATRAAAAMDGVVFQFALSPALWNERCDSIFMAGRGGMHGGSPCASRLSASDTKSKRMGSVGLRNRGAKNLSRMSDSESGRIEREEIEAVRALRLWAQRKRNLGLLSVRQTPGPTKLDRTARCRP
jgi:hypothetical protein